MSQIQTHTHTYIYIYNYSDLSNFSTSIFISKFTFRQIPLGKVYELPCPRSYGLNSTTTVLLEEWLWHQMTYKG